MFRKVDDFIAVFNDEAKFTSQVFHALTDASLWQSINNDHRTIGRLAWHLTRTIPEMLGKIGLAATGPGEHEVVPSTARTIAAAYDAAAKSVPEAIAKAKWTDADLENEFSPYGEPWTVAYTLRAFLLHQAHHRAQVTTLMRQAGLQPPALYGPRKEDWAKMGMQPPAI
jgi:uncharacterized damage-inducible protein DinB